MKNNLDNKEPRFNFSRNWLLFMCDLTGDEQLRLFRAIADYGLYGREPENLTCAVADYFANVIRPNLDRQLKRKGARYGKE